MYSLNFEWRRTLEWVVANGVERSPRGKLTKELLHHTVVVDMRYPVLTIKERKLNHRFMMAEALWILRGSNLLADLTSYNKRMAEFSDDGVTLTGAYGVPFVAQLDYVAAKLAEDPETRQATLTLWRPNPAPSKDVPCTVALDFKLRDGRLHAQVFMRSSDIWLGLPYDVFSFTMMTCRVGERVFELSGRRVELGGLYLTAASSHLYKEHLETAKTQIRLPLPFSPHPLPVELYQPAGGRTLIDRLATVLDDLAPRWWE